jgi:hypothetical protein
MTQNELNRAVARATGESRGTIREFGFSLASQEPPPPTVPTLAVDCPGCGAPLEIDSTEPARGLIECSRCDAFYPYADHEIYVTDSPQTVLAACA